MHKLVTKLIKDWPEQFTSDFSYAVALSGGVDSVVLLHIFHQIKTHNHPISLSAIHIDHGISSKSKQWTDFCQNICNSLGIPLQISRHQITKSGGESLENNARQARYQTFFKHKADVIILAHHQNDQVETTLSQIFRGSDLHNVAAMNIVSQKQDKIFWRPLLNISRSEIEAYAKEFLLEYITDESNFDTIFLRNFIRHNILPALINWDKNIATKILNFNSQIKDSIELIDDLAEQDLHNIANVEHSIIDLAKFKALNQVRRANVISYFIRKQNLPLPSSKQIKEFIHQAITSRFDKTPQLKLNNNNEIVKYKQQIFVRIL